MEGARAALLILTCLMSACTWFGADPVTRAVRNCQQLLASSPAVLPGSDDPCELIRSTCDIDRGNPACQSLLARYQ